MKRYVGDPGTWMIRVYDYEGDQPTREQLRRCYLLDPRYDLARHSRHGFAWGYSGSGPAQCALALVSDVLGRSLQTDEVALRLHQAVKWEFVSRLPGAFDVTDGEILDAIEAVQRREARHDA